MEAEESRSVRLLSQGEELARLGSWELDLQSGEMLWSDELYRIVGLEPGGPPTSADEALERVHPEDHDRVERLIEAVTEDPDAAIPATGYTTEFRIVRPDGEIRQVRTTTKLEQGPSGDTRWVGVIQDITEASAAQELQAHHRLSATLRDWDGFDEGVVALLERIGDALGYPMASLWLWDDGAKGLKCRAFWNEADNDPGLFEFAKRSMVFRPGEGKPGMAWQTEAPVITLDTATDPIFQPRDAAMTRGVRSGVAFPAIGPDGPIAVLSFYSFEHRVPSASLRRTLASLGQNLGRFLHRRRAQLQPSPLTPRELEVIRLAAEGNSRPQIAELLGISPLTVKTHFENIFEKLGVSDRTAAVAEAIRSGLID
jgi:DNA-binding CsgD family transcriptional regulator